MDTFASVATSAADFDPCARVDCVCQGCRHHLHKDKKFYAPLNMPGIASYLAQGAGGDSVSVYAYHFQIIREASRGCPFCKTVRQLLEGNCSCRFQSSGSESSHAPTGKGVDFLYWPEDHVRRGLLCGKIMLHWSCGSTTVELRFPRLGVGHRTTIPEVPLPQEYMKFWSGQSPDERPLLQSGFDEIQEDPLSATAIRMYREWLCSCDESHRVCASLKPGELPTRVLHLGGMEPSDVVRLAPGSGVSGRYVALSYCWGGLKPPLATKSNLYGLQQGILFDDLPKTYQDAIQLARALNVIYLWIDSLCIIQDDKDDWDRESSLMGQIFRDAYVVVIAATAQNIKSGFLQPRTKHFSFNTSDLVGYGMKTATGSSAPQRLRFREAVPHPPLDICLNTQVATRGWCYQERLMARRCLIFNQLEAIWECRHGCKCECGTPRYECVDTDVRQLPRLLPVLSSDSEDPTVKRTIRHFANAEKAFRFWRLATEDYSRRAFSVPTDRLIAMTALASVVQATTGSSYLAGLWESDVLVELLWQGFAQRTIPFDVYVAPSWSWASCPGVATYGQPSLTPKLLKQNTSAEVIAAWCHQRDGNPFGAVDSGAIVLRACCATARLRPLPKSYSNPDPDLISWWRSEITLCATGAQVIANGGVDFDGNIGCATMTDQHGSTIEVLQPAHRSKQSASSTQTPHGEVCILRVGHSTNDDKSERCHCLLLAYSLQEPGAFERVGLLTVDSNSNLELFRELQAAWSVLEIKII